jgi:hypothetical protein
MLQQCICYNENVYVTTPFSPFFTLPLMFYTISLANIMLKDPFLLMTSSMMKDASSSWNPLISKSNSFWVLSFSRSLKPDDIEIHKC